MATFKGFTQATIDFMWNLRLNNKKPWFEEHKQEFIDVFQNPMKALGQEVFERIEDDFGGRGLYPQGAVRRRTVHGKFGRSHCKGVHLPDAVLRLFHHAGFRPIAD